MLRIVAEEQEQLRVGLEYSLEDRQNYNGVPALTSERILAGLQKARDRVDKEITPHQKKSKKRPGHALRKALANTLNEFPPVLIDHAMRVAAFDPNTPLETLLEDKSLTERLMVALGEAQRIVDNLATSVTCQGYIIATAAKRASATVPRPVSNDEIAGGDSPIYEDFHPFRPEQFEDNPEIIMLEYESFNRTVDEFFSSIESQKLESRLTEREENAKRKLETARLDHQKRLGGLQQVQELNVRKAQAIEANLQKVQEATAAVNALISQGMDWQEIARLIEMEQERHNVVADIIKLPLKLYENTTTLLLSEATYEDENEFNGDETESDVSESEDDVQNISKASKVEKPADNRLAVDIDLALSPWSNARQYYEQKRSAAVKEQKTLQSSEKALKSTEMKISADLKKGLNQEKEVMRPQRKANWFEKYIHFISSENYLVLGGKDAQQNEILYKRHLKKGDKYVHADLHGAASVIVKNRPGMSESPIPPSTLSQAGTLAVATSSAWDSKAVMSAWWVDANQVSKIALTGEFLPSGSFEIRGDKNFLPPTQLLLGFGIMFKVSEESKIRHLRHRIQDHAGLTPSELAKDIKRREDEQNPEDGMEIHTKDQHIEDSKNGNQKVDHVQDADCVDSKSGDVSGDESSDLMPGNPLQPTGGQQSALDPPSTDDILVKNLGTELHEAKSGEYNDEELENEQRELDPSNDYSYNQTPQVSTKEHQLLLRVSPIQTSSTITDLEDNINSAQLSDMSIQRNIKSLPPRVRGKHGKFLKLKTKYADQDEEDRALAMRLLGSSTAQDRAAEDAGARADKEKELVAQKERRRRQHALADERGREAEELRKLEFEEGIEILDENHELEEFGDLDAFVGAPLPGDEILDALVICGPWDAIGGRCKWRAKLQPGITKKGKAVREILGKWNGIMMEGEKKGRSGNGEGDEAMLEEKMLRMREGELIKAIREPEVIGVIPVGKVRVVMGQGETAGKGSGGRGAGKGNRGGKGTKRQR